MAYKHAYLTLLFLHSTFLLSVVKMSLKGEVGGHALNTHGNYIVDHGKSWKNHEIVFLNFYGNLGTTISAPPVFTINIHTPPHRECSGSVVECLTRDRRAAGSSLTGVTVLCP